MKNWKEIGQSKVSTKQLNIITFSFLKEKVVQIEPEWKTVNGVDVYEGIIWAKRR